MEKKEASEDGVDGYMNFSNGHARPVVHKAYYPNTWHFSHPSVDNYYNMRSNIHKIQHFPSYSKPIISAY
jgi:hypothetical protein